MPLRRFFVTIDSCSKVTNFIFRYHKIGVRGSRSQDVQISMARSSARRVQKDDLSAGKRQKVRSWIFPVPPLSKQKQALI